MNTADDYLVPAQCATERIVEKKSEFIASLCIAETEEEALAFLENVRTKHRTANHNVYAYVLRNNARSRYSDDGEPAKTAGLPVLSAIQHAGICNCIVVVTRYFGGTLLGTGGLVRAYTAAASAAIAAAGTKQIRAVHKISVTMPYPVYEQALRIINSAGAKLAGEPEFGADVHLEAVLPEQETEALSAKLKELLRGDNGIDISKVYHAPF